MKGFHISASGAIQALLFLHQGVLLGPHCSQFFFPLSRCLITPTLFTVFFFLHQDVLVGPHCSHFFFPSSRCLIRSTLFTVFSSTGQRPASYCHGVVSVGPCVHASVNSSFKKLLLRNYRLDFYEISQECSLDGPL